MKTIDKILRKKTLFQFGFGIDAMKTATVCENCNSLEDSRREFCSKCGAKLPEANLYDYYRAQHDSCPHCQNVISKAMDFCTKCGTQIKKTI